MTQVAVPETDAAGVTTFPPADLRSALATLAGAGLLSVVEKEVDPAWELTAVLDRLEQAGRLPAVLFNAVQAHPGWSVAANLFAARASVAAVLGCSVADVTTVLAARLAAPIPPVVVEHGACQEVVLSGSDATLDAVPLVTHHEGDAAPYISMGVTVCRDPDTGQRNVGIYRYMRQSATTLVPLTSNANIADIFRRVRGARPAARGRDPAGRPSARRARGRVQRADRRGRVRRRGCAAGRSAAARSRDARGSRGAGGCRGRDRGPHPARRAASRGAVRRHVALIQPRQAGTAHRGRGDHPPPARDLRDRLLGPPRRDQHGGHLPRGRDLRGGTPGGTRAQRGRGAGQRLRLPLLPRDLASDPPWRVANAASRSTRCSRHSVPRR